MHDPKPQPRINLDPDTFEALRIALGVPKITFEGKPVIFVTTWHQGLPNKPFMVVGED